MGLKQYIRPSLLVCTLALPLSEGGCNARAPERACFSWTNAEGACPAQHEALDFFSDGVCTALVDSVDSEGTFDGNRCCYDVTVPRTHEFFGDPSKKEELCSPGTTGPTKPGIPIPPSEVDGGAGGACDSCSSFTTAVFQGSASSIGACPESQPIVGTLFECLCAGPCQSACAPEACFPITSGSIACFDCATDSAVGCGSQFSACMDDI